MNLLRVHVVEQNISHHAPHPFLPLSDCLALPRPRPSVTAVLLSANDITVTGISPYYKAHATISSMEMVATLANEQAEFVSLSLLNTAKNPHLFDLTVLTRNVKSPLATLL